MMKVPPLFKTVCETALAIALTAAIVAVIVAFSVIYIGTLGYVNLFEKAMRDES